MTDERIKAHIQRRFSQAAPSYERWAAAQRQAARRLVSLLPEQVFDQVLDIGCGTGFLAEELFAQGKARCVTGIDLAPDMVAYCRRRWPTQSFFCADAEFFEPTHSFDLILSNFVFQWLADIPAAMHRYGACLKNGGMLALAVPVSGSLRELRASSLKAGRRPLRLMAFPAAEELNVAMGGVAGGFFHRELEWITAWFTTPLEAVRSLKGIGASYGGEDGYTVAEMRRLLKEYGEGFGDPVRGCPVSYRLWFGVAAK
ncbi:MAG: methyltransferase domain-containing protein [Deltaproteobacteria bacterium]|nr:methyltransferase domain-containing protein [Deltaproteobacteria bacterium]